MFNWKDEYSVGVASIDDQHRKLFEMGQSMSDLVANHAGEDIYDELNAMFNELINYTEYHFDHEEHLMAQANYTDLEIHKNEHRKFIDKLHGFDLIAMDEAQGDFAMSLLKTVATWIFKHITGDDFKYRSTLRNYS